VFDLRRVGAARIHGQLRQVVILTGRSDRSGDAQVGEQLHPLRQRVLLFEDAGIGIPELECKIPFDYSLGVSPEFFSARSTAAVSAVFTLAAATTSWSMMVFGY
jgi:hypothetical protein